MPEAMTDEHKARMAAGKRLAMAEDTSQLISAACEDMGPRTAGLVKDRALEVPKTCVRTYLTAMRGKSKQAGIRAYCQMCLGWQDFRAGIQNCTDPSCPLYTYRPYRGS